MNACRPVADGASPAGTPSEQPAPQPRKNCSRSPALPASIWVQMEFKCPHCGKVLEVDAASAHQHGDCPACGRDLEIPDPPAEPQAPHVPEIHIGSPWVETKPKHPVGRKLTITLILIVLIAPIVLFLGNNASKKSASIVYLINGTNQVQTVQINRSRHRIEAGAREKLQVRTPWYYFRKTHRIKYDVGGESTNIHGLRGVMIVNLAGTTLVRAGILSETGRDLWGNYQAKGLWIVKRDWNKNWQAFDVDHDPYQPGKVGACPLLLDAVRSSGPQRADQPNLLDDAVPGAGASSAPRQSVKLKGVWIIVGTYNNQPTTLAEWKRKMREGVVSGGLLGKHKQSVSYWTKQATEWSASFPPGRKPSTLDATNQITEIVANPEFTAEDKYKQIWRALGGDPTTPGFEIEERKADEEEEDAE